MEYSPENVLVVLARLRVSGVDEPTFWTHAGKNHEGRVMIRPAPYSQLTESSQLAYWDDLLDYAGISDD